MTTPAIVGPLQVPGLSSVLVRLSGTTENAVLYRDADLTMLAPNPLPANQYGYFQAWMDQATVDLCEPDGSVVVTLSAASGAYAPLDSPAFTGTPTINGTPIGAPAPLIARVRLVSGDHLDNDGQQDQAGNLPPFAGTSRGWATPFGMGPTVVDAGGAVMSVDLIEVPAFSVGTLTLDNHTALKVSNADGTERLSITLDIDALITSDTPGGIGDTYGTWIIDDHVGTDLTIVGPIIESAAGGAFWISGTVYLKPSSDFA